MTVLWKSMYFKSEVCEKFQAFRMKNVNADTRKRLDSDCLKHCKGTVLHNCIGSNLSFAFISVPIR